MAAMIDASHADLDLVMTEGDVIRFNFLVIGEALWAGTAYTCHVKDVQDASADPLAELTVVATADGEDCDVLITSAAVPELVEGEYFWDMQETGGVTRFGGAFTVRPQVTA